MNFTQSKGLLSSEFWRLIVQAAQLTFSSHSLAAWCHGVEGKGGNMRRSKQKITCRIRGERFRGRVWTWDFITIFLKELLRGPIGAFFWGHVYSNLGATSTKPLMESSTILRTKSLISMDPWGTLILPRTSHLFPISVSVIATTTLPVQSQDLACQFLHVSSQIYLNHSLLISMAPCDYLKCLFV